MEEIREWSVDNKSNAQMITNLLHGRRPAPVTPSLAEMNQVNKGNQWRFGMKAYIGVDRQARLIHLVVAAVVNVAES